MMASLDHRIPHAPHLLCLILLLPLAAAWNVENLAGPATAAAQPAWLAAIASQRAQWLTRNAYNASVYDDYLPWTSRQYVVPQSHLFDRYLYDDERSTWTVDRFLDDLELRYGGIDGVLLWWSYPNLGIDERSQFDVIGDVPGGLRALAEVVAAFHRRGVRVGLPYNPWDTGTARRAGQSDAAVLASIAAAVGADFINGDTMDFMSYEFFNASVRAGRPVALQPEGAPDHLSLAWTKLGWAYWSDQGVPGGTSPAAFVPQVDLFKWLERRHMTQICNRWSANHTSDVQQAFFNGIGFVSWENIWGVMRQLVDRDAEALRRTATLSRWLHPFLLAPAWEPHTRLVGDDIDDGSTTGSGTDAPVLPSPFGAGVFASAWPLNASTTTRDFPLRRDARAWTVVKRSAGDWDEAPLLRVACPATAEGEGVSADGELMYFDLYHGVQIKPVPVPASVMGVSASGHAAAATAACALPLAIEGNGFGAALELSAADARTHAAALDALLAAMRTMTQRPLSSYSPQLHVLPQRMTDWGRTAAPAVSPPDMVLLPAVAAWNFSVRGTEIEGADAPGVDVAFPWEATAFKVHAPHALAIGALWMDRTPVTNAQFAAFLAAAGYAPARGSDPRRNFLRDWSGCDGGSAADAGTSSGSGSGSASCTYPVGWDRKPVTWVDLADASAYCAFYGKRLPNDWEWQYAVQGAEAVRRWPWGDTWNASNVPARTTGTTRPAPPDVGSVPAGASPLGVLDLMGLVWQWTNEFADAHTRAGLVRGGAHYRPTVNARGGQSWYFRADISDGGGVHANAHGKVLLMAPAYDRHGTVGFRCVADV